jgi:hypothetical protein
MARLTRPTDAGTLAAECADFLRPQAAAMLETLAALAGKGKGLADGVAVQFGWSVLRLRRRGGELAVCEPDFAGDPFDADSRDLTRTLGVIAQQCEFLARHNAEPLDVRFDEKVIAAKGCLDRPAVFLARSAPVPGDSGWYVGPLDGPPGDDAAGFEAVFVYELWSKRKALLPVLPLPPGWVVEFDGDAVKAVVPPPTRPA